jgi:hypothetical protein
MSRALEVFYLPLLFLTVTLLGGLRLAPPLSALVLAVLLVGVLVRGGALAPQRLLHAGRPPLANLNGAVVVLTMFAAAVQVFNVVIPESGLPRVIVVVFLFLLILNTLTASPDRTHVLRSIAVIVGSTFVLKFIVLAALSETEGGWLKRVLVAALHGVTLGTLTQAPFSPVTGYVAFATLTIFLVGLALLPSSPDAGPGTLVTITEATSHPPRGHDDRVNDRTAIGKASAPTRPT